MIRVGVVVQRYGNEVVGGAETLAKNIAERLNSSGLDVTVFTTTAKNYITWKNEYPAGESISKGVILKRFKVEYERNIEQFNQFSDKFFQEQAHERDENEWINRQGPFSPQLVENLSAQQNNFDVFIFFTYLYYTTIEGMKNIRKPIILVPTAHDELPIYLTLMKAVFNRPDALFFLTQAEMAFVQHKFPSIKEKVLIRTGVDLHEKRTQIQQLRKKFRLWAPYIVYAGRIEKGKGLEIVFESFDHFCKHRLIDLVLIGKKLMNLPAINRLKYLGYISEEEKRSVFHHAIFTIQPSPFESLSITTLESFAQKTPVLVNKKCAVLNEHVDLSNGGLTYDNGDEFSGNFYKMYDDKRLRRTLGIQGYQYVRQNFSWENVISKIKTIIHSMVS